MVLPAAWLAKKISLAALGRNWLIVTLANLLGAFFVAWFFGHYVGLTEGEFLHKTIAVAEGKVSADFGRALVSGIGCNWMVCMGVWLCYGTQSMSGKILGIWFPIMIFVLIGFQHVVANMFVIPAAIWGGADIELDAIRLEYAVGLYRQCYRRRGVCRRGVLVFIPQPAAAAKAHIKIEKQRPSENFQTAFGFLKHILNRAAPTPSAMPNTVSSSEPNKCKADVATAAPQRCALQHADHPQAKSRKTWSSCRENR